MPTEIKFRVWNREEQEIMGHEEIQAKDSDEWCTYNMMTDKRKVVKSSFEFMQYTGLHDETDEETEIYEEDIIQFSYQGEKYTGVVKFDSGSFIVVCDELEDGYLQLLDIAEYDRDYSWINGKVMGNTFETVYIPNEEVEIVWGATIDGTSYCTNIAGFGISVFKRIWDENRWYLSCQELGIEGSNALEIYIEDEEDVEKIKFKALSMIMEILEDYQKLIDKLSTYMVKC